MADVLAAADRAYKETGQKLLPFNFERWLALGFIAFLEQCARGGSPCNLPGSSGGGDGGSGGRGIEDGLGDAMAYMASHVVLVAAVAAVALAVFVALLALVLWIGSRGTFMYLDNVATGRADVGRPWREHAERAGSYFAWTFGLTLFTFLSVLALLLPLGWSIYSLVKRGPEASLVIVLASAIVAFLILILGASLLSVALRDFVAPLQWSRGLSCGAALKVFLGLLRVQPMLFVAYLLFKIVFQMVAGILGLIAACLTCCCGLLPVVHQTLLQPVYYFERRWSLEVLRDLGYEMPGAT